MCAHRHTHTTGAPGQVTSALHISTPVQYKTFTFTKLSSNSKYRKTDYTSTAAISWYDDRMR